MSSTKSFYAIVSLTICFWAILCSFSHANIPPDPNAPPPPAPAGDVELPFDPDEYSFLVYDPGGDQSRIEAAMDLLEIPHITRDFDDDVTPADLSTHDILIVGWNYEGDTSGLNAAILA